MLSVHVSLNLKRGLNIFPQEIMAAGENRFAPELNEEKDIELLENTIPGSIKKATKYGVEIFQGENFFLTICAHWLIFIVNKRTDT